MHELATKRRTTIDKIVVGAGATAEAATDRAVDAAANLAAAYDAELVVVSFAEPHIRDMLDPDAPPDVDEGVDAFRRRYPDVKARGRVASDRHLQALVDLAKEERAEVVVLATVIGAEGNHHPAGSDPGAPAVTGGRARGPVRRFYGDRLGWATLFLLAVLLTYGGGGVMFWVHALVRGERGPAIDPWQHWLLDSTLGFIALTPVLFFLLPAALWMLGRRLPGHRLKLWSYVALVGVLFTLVTGPGPLLHNEIAGDGTSLAELAARVLGHNAHVAEQNMHAVSHSGLSEALVQLAVGLPVYLALTWIALRVLRAVVSRRRETHAPSNRPSAGRLSPDGPTSKENR